MWRLCKCCHSPLAGVLSHRHKLSTHSAPVTQCSPQRSPSQLDLSPPTIYMLTRLCECTVCFAPGKPLSCSWKPIHHKSYTYYYCNLKQEKGRSLFPIKQINTWVLCATWIRFCSWIRLKHLPYFAPTGSKLLAGLQGWHSFLWALQTHFCSPSKR